MNTWEQFFNFMANECGMAVTEDGAVHCSECGEPIYEEDFEGGCPSCGCIVEGEGIVEYQDRVEILAGLWSARFENNMTKEDHAEFHQQCKDWQVEVIDVLEVI